MSGLQPAHRGYEYQDLMVAIRSIDLLLGGLCDLIVEEKLVDDDRFDDLTTQDVIGGRERIQIKHTDQIAQSLSLATFTSESDARQLRLDRLMACAIADREGPGASAVQHTYRLVMRDIRPADALLRTILKPAVIDPGPMVAGFTTLRLQFDADELWDLHVGNSGMSRGHQAILETLRNIPDLTRSELEWFCEAFVVEVEAPSMSGDFGNPGAAEQILLERVTSEIGAGQFPNSHRAPRDACESIVGAARMARQGRIRLTASELLRRSGLRGDFGSTAHHNPVEADQEIVRSTVIPEAVAIADQSAGGGGVVILEGPPGQGKSWACKQLTDHLRTAGWLVAEHYCYLGSGDTEREIRVQSDHLFGTILDSLQQADPATTSSLRPRFAVSPQALEDAIQTSLASNPLRNVAIVVDGLDHVSRIAPLSRFQDPSRTLVEELASLKLPSGCVLIVLSQPGDHLIPLLEADARVHRVSGLSEKEVAELALKHGVALDSVREAGGSPSIVEIFCRRSQGNALYLTYLCREILRRKPGIDIRTSIEEVPAYDGSLSEYYQFLHDSLGDRAAWVSEYLAFLDFSVTSAEIGQIQPDRASHVAGALRVLSPVLRSDDSGGYRIYHESLSRFLADRLEAVVIAAINDRISSWLLRDGLFADERAYRFAMSTLARAEKYSDVVELIEETFVARSIAAGFPARSIRQNLSVAADCAARIGNWPVVVRCVELARSASEYEGERFDTVLVEFADILVAVIGGEEIADRLIFDGQPVVSGRSGLIMCSALDQMGVVVPWTSYIDAFIEEQKADDTSYGANADETVYLAMLRGRLRAIEFEVGDDDLSRWVESRQFRRLVDYIDNSGLSIDRIAEVVVNTVGPAAALMIVENIEASGAFALAAVRCLASLDLVEDSSAKELLSLALHFSDANRNVRIFLDLGVSSDGLISGRSSERRKRLLDLTIAMQRGRDRDAAVHEWLDSCLVAAMSDPDGLLAAEALVQGEFWYAYWLRFCIQLVRAETGVQEEQSAAALQAIRLLTVRTHPFEGNPRTVDLYGIWEPIADTIYRAVCRMSDTDWQVALALLREMSPAISISMRGEFSGPFASDDLIKLIIMTGKSVERHSLAIQLVRSIADESSAKRHYSDIAVYRLLEARFALQIGDLDRAETLWIESCRYLAGYGFHKDRTIYEILEPLSLLGKLRPAHTRSRLFLAQQLAKRVISHTDGKETRHSLSVWWRRLALADPYALAHMASLTLLDSCNLVNKTLDDARADLWEEWYNEVDPVLATLLRCTLGRPFDEHDIVGYERLLEVEHRPKGIDAQYASLADEYLPKGSSSSYSDTNAYQQNRVDAMNSVSGRRGAPVVAPWMQFDDPVRIENDNQFPRLTHLRTPRTSPLIQVVDSFTPGAPGVLQAVREWRTMLGDQSRSEERIRFVNVIGYRFLELIQQGREGDVRFSLRSIGEADEYRSEHALLPLLADGLSRLGHDRLAAMAHAYHWTRSRAGGGWLNFGGEDHIDSLQRAIRLDQRAAMEVLSEEIQRTIRGWNVGVTQALIFAFALVDMPAPPGTSSIDLAFACWDEAAAIIAYRTPEVHPYDEPLQPYSGFSRDVEGAYEAGELEVGFAIATVAGISHPSRERKRRSFLSFLMLLEMKPLLAGEALARCMHVIQDLATIGWILKLIESSASRQSIVERCQSELLNLTKSDNLSIRSLARRVLGVELAGDLPLTFPDSALLNTGGPVSFWLSSSSGNEEILRISKVARIRLETILGARLDLGEELLPGLREAVLGRFDAETSAESFRQRIDSQADGLGRGDWWPDAYTAIEETAEAALQRTAGGGRLAMLANGAGVLGEAWEQQLADAISDDPLPPLDIEATRFPRPAVPIAPGEGSSIWRELAKQLDGSGDHRSFDHAYLIDGRGPAVGTSIHAATQCVVVSGGQFDGWRIIGSEECRTITDAADRDTRFISMRLSGLEFRNLDDTKGLEAPSLMNADAGFWELPIPPDVLLSIPVSGQPLLGYDRGMDGFGDAKAGLGIPEQIMVPSLWIRGHLHLESQEPYVLSDDQGIAMALITWRTEYERSDYHLEWPRLKGSAIVVRPDLLQRLESEFGSFLKLREVIVGPNKFIGATQPYTSP